jgi:hypothetical protein
MMPLRFPIDDVEEVSNYVAAMQHGLRRIKGGFPLLFSRVGLRGSFNS